MSRNPKLVEAPASSMELVLARLQERRLSVEKEVLKYGEAPAGIKEVFELSRGFERAYVTFVNESPVAGKIKESFMGEQGLAGSVKALPLDKVFELVHVKQLARTADGYQPHLVSPECGMRELASEALEQMAVPVKKCTHTVFTLLVNAARDAAENAGKFTESALMGSYPMHVPDFKTLVMPAIVVALEEWKLDAERMANMLVEMERSYMTAGFFRHTMHSRSAKIKQQMLLAEAGKQAPVPGKAGAAAPSGGKSFFPAFGASPQVATPAAAPPPSTPRGQAADAASDASDEAGASPGKEGTPAPSGFNASEMSDPNSFLAATFEKYNGNDTNFTSVTALVKWQKRFFIFSEAQRMLYYFKSTEEVGKGVQPRGMIPMAECHVEDLDAQMGLQKGSQPLLLLRIRNKDARIAVHKENQALVLRAETVEQKVQWLARLRGATDPVRRTASKAIDGADSLDPSAKPPAMMPSFGGSIYNMAEDAHWKDAEPIMDTHLGEGSSAFRAEAMRDKDGRLPPAPQTLINPMRISEKARKATGVAAFEARHDAIMEQFGSDISMYTRMVCDTVVTTVPKAIVHCMIRKSEKNLLERLFTVIHHLTPSQLETLLKEEDQVVMKRKEARAALEDCKTSVFKVQQVLERHNMTAAVDRPVVVDLSVDCFGYAGMPEMIAPEDREYFNKLFSGPHAPDAMRSWTIAPVVRTPHGTPPKPGAGAPKANGAKHAEGGAEGRPHGPPAPRGPPPAGQSPGQPGSMRAPTTAAQQAAALARPSVSQQGMGPGTARRAAPPPPGAPLPPGGPR
mmetsp:Transcript_19122/g.32848  ORF Transcript_19122/g.32848 Transcript_19122/m.32848 type:complete len:797 (-) Transcript_19122:788-3178(-)|eukprot:CAMPEP_0119110572 /NCGR_PEP_ID=MMETSP1180-20130426/30542_1 /TAXON_ID=3052 ORGANISM="Chlamydomonas cf sp, Strain CCMP681" /NCGR_SAMPLE_ID=MMETSP1180 /ASSEMBLY_ACC=CAM_ASM_000741 /LENGTH=796 /DNA_ID=CAMNT_0007096983 /DNA_START=51 /DNA_END=2441 /DNA_ORIENTATION=+